MAKVIAGMTISLDGFIADERGDHGMLYSDFEELDGPYLDEVREVTGAALMGRTTFDGAEDPDGYADGYEFQVPIVVLTHDPPAVEPKRNDRLFFSFVTAGVEAAVARAAELAGDRAVTVIGGADLNQQLLAAGLVDELWVDVMPVLLGDGLRLFERAPRLALEKLGVVDMGARTSLRFRVLRPG
ncbi:dihydrofolate reductase family protein [Modestobacter sp. I12A-02662]|uniref:dihydrofolate reductase family protein n=1 Tax=Modestobacter sp. I12A-02662 TaxID=1730496 RepID=UPI0034DE7897